MSDSERVKELLVRLVESSASEEEVRELLSLTEDSGNEASVREITARLWNDYNTQEVLPDADWKKMYAAVIATPVAGRVKIRRLFKRVAAAAAIILIASIGFRLFFKKSPSSAMLARQPQEQRFKNDVQPGTNGAILTLGNGRQILIDSVNSGLIATQGNASVVKQNNELSYQAGNTQATVVYNTLSTPRGRQFPNLVLPDGSKVWLDAGSSIRFPTVFTGNERKVEVTGQVWFDVVHNEKMPFKVMVKGTEIEDIGTQFDVNAYDDESSVQVTLLQGSVQLMNKGKSPVVVKPGQQAKITQNGQLTINKDVNLDEVMAWKNGVFLCDDTDVASVMKQIARWYDVDVTFEQPVTKQISLLNVPRSVTLTQILKIMEMTGNVKFLVDGKKVTVLPL